MTQEYIKNFHPDILLKQKLEVMREVRSYDAALRAAIAHSFNVTSDLANTLNEEQIKLLRETIIDAFMAGFDFKSSL